MLIMLNHNELAIIKDGVLTLDGYSCSKIYKLLGMCCNPGRYKVNSTSHIEDMCWMSDGKSVWIYQREAEIGNQHGIYSTERNVITNKKTKEELLLLKESINKAISHSTRYYEVKNNLYRVTKDSLFYLKELRNSKDIKQYKENEVPLSIIDKILKGVVSISPKTDTLIYNDRREIASQEKIKRHYDNGTMSYFGYSNIDGYYVRLDLDQTVCIEICSTDNTFDCFIISFEDIKELIVIDYLKE